MPLGGDRDREQFSKSTGVPIEALFYSEFINQGRWPDVDAAIRPVYEEAGKALGREFPYPGDKEQQ